MIIYLNLYIIRFITISPCTRYNLNTKAFFILAPMPAKPGNSVALNKHHRTFMSQYLPVFHSIRYLKVQSPSPVPPTHPAWAGRPRGSPSTGSLCQTVSLPRRISPTRPSDLPLHYKYLLLPPRPFHPKHQWNSPVLVQVEAWPRWRTSGARRGLRARRRYWHLALPRRPTSSTRPTTLTTTSASRRANTLPNSKRSLRECVSVSSPYTCCPIFFHVLLLFVLVLVFRSRSFSFYWFISFGAMVIPLKKCLS